MRKPQLVASVLALAAALCFFTMAAPAPRYLEFGYPTNWITSNVWFNLYYKPTLQPTQNTWLFLTNFSALNANHYYGLINSTQYFRVQFIPTQDTIFFGATASNSYHGLESDVTPTTEPMPAGFLLRIRP